MSHSENANRLKNAIAFLLSALISYAVAEAGYSYAYRYGMFDTARDGWFFEEAGKTIQFDPVIGYRLTSTPSRTLKIAEGQIEYEGVFRGNNQGFQDRDDFYPERPKGNPFRVAVLGDSFSTEQFMAVNWPDRVEDLAKASPGARPLQMLNFSLYSGGLVNWRNILLERIEKEGYDIDLLVIPVFANDLFRPFMLLEARDTRKLLIGQAGLDPDKLPGTLKEARPLLSESDGYILTASEWQRLHAEGWHPELPRPAHFYLAEHASFLVLLGVQRVQSLFEPTEEVVSAIPMPGESQYVPDPALQRGRFTAAHARLINDIRQSLHRKTVPVMVVRVPDRDELLYGLNPAGNVEEFAELLGAPLIDGSQAFFALESEERKAQYFPYDGHWNQGGSDHFARFMLVTIKQQMEHENVPLTSPR